MSEFLFVSTLLIRIHYIDPPPHTGRENRIIFRTVPVVFMDIYGVIFQQIVGNNLNHIDHENIK